MCCLGGSVVAAVDAAAAGPRTAVRQNAPLPSSARLSRPVAPPGDAASLDVWSTLTAHGPLTVGTPTRRPTVRSGQSKPAAMESRLVGIDALDHRDAWAVGDTVTDGVTTTLVERWDGTSWARVASPNPGGQLGTTLSAVAVLNRNSVWAAGSYGAPDGQIRTLMLHWDGSRWHRVGTPNPGQDGPNVLTGLTAVSTRDIWAVGWHSSTSIPSVTLTLHWDGRSWHEVPSPNPSHRYGNQLAAATAISSEDVWAVGWFAVDATVRETLVAQWNGKRWTRPLSPSPGALDNELTGVAATPSGDVWAVGSSADVPLVSSALAERLTGHGWQTVPVVDPGGDSSAFASTTAAADDDVWAVGWVDQAGIAATLIEHWNGRRWSVVPSPSPGPFGSTLDGAAAVSRRDAWAVGSFRGSLLDASPLVERWDGASWTTP
jgi:hypothetical protein